MSKSEAKCTQASINWNISGKVAIVDFGKLTSGYGGSFSRTYEIPEDWTEEDLDNFQLDQRQKLEDLLEPIDQHHADERLAQKNW